MKKFKLTKKSIEVFGKTLFQIKALKEFGDVEKGDLGGYIEKDDNISQEGDAWVYGNARVYGDARVYGNAWVSGDAWVYGDARVYGDVWVSGDARVYGKLKIKIGFYFGILFKGEKIKKIKIEDNTLLWKE